MSGKGHIQYRNGAAYITISLGFDANKERVRYTETYHPVGRNEKEQHRDAERYRDQLRYELENGLKLPSPGMTFGEWSTWWLTWLEGRRARRTIDGYRSHLEKRIIPKLGSIPLHQLRRKHIIDFMDNLGAAGIKLDRFGQRTSERLSATTQNSYLRTLSTCLETAVERELIASNPARRCPHPPVVKPKARFYEESDVTKLLAALADSPPRLRALYLLGMTTGLRRGEIVALEWSDVDFAGKCVSINEAVEVIEGKHQAIKDTKNTNSRRIIPVPDITLEALRTWQAAQNAAREKRLAKGKEWRAGDYICSDRTGKWLLADQLTREFGRFVRTNKLKSLSLHGLRHTAASQLLAAGVPVHTVSKLLGHARPSTTLDVYSHVLTGSMRQAAETMQTLLSSKLSSTEQTTAQSEHDQPKA